MVKKSKLPFVSICTPTFNRRPFIPYLIKCFEHQTYPKDKMEWIIVDDGTDKIEELVKDIPQVKYYKYDVKMSLGMKRNLTNKYAEGEIIIYMDDDDYYPPERVIHAVNTLLENPKALCAGSSIMYIYYKNLNEMYKCGPYGPNHSTAATFAFRKDLLKITSFEENVSVAEEKLFLKNYTIPFVQLDPLKSILVFSHKHNSYDKNDLLENKNSFINLSTLTPSDFVKEKDILDFFMGDIEEKLNNYELGEAKYKPDVLKEVDEKKMIRKEKMDEYSKKQKDYQEMMNKLQNNNNEYLQNKMNNMSVIIQELNMENNLLKNKITYLEKKIKDLIEEKIKSKQIKND